MRVPQIFLAEPIYMGMIIIRTRIHRADMKQNL